jgi:hypothetical protein
MPSSDESSTFSGTVTELEVGGNGSNSAQLEFSVTPPKGAGDDPETFVVEFATEPQVCAAMAALLTAAYVEKMIVTVTYTPRPGATPKAAKVKLGAPAASNEKGRLGFV